MPSGKLAAALSSIVFNREAVAAPYSHTHRNVLCQTWPQDTLENRRGVGLVPVAEVPEVPTQRRSSSDKSGTAGSEVDAQFKHWNDWNEGSKLFSGHSL